MHIDFEKTRWKNFLATGNDWIELDLKKHSSTLVLGRNGAGKSTFLDAISFCLFKKPFRKITLPKLVNSITKKNCVVETEFNTGGHHYLVRRGLKPALFEILKDGEKVDQTIVRDFQVYLESVLGGMSHRTFGQQVILGSAKYVPFMALDAKERRLVIEDLLDMEIFSAMNVLLKERINTNRDELSQAERLVSIATGKLQVFDRQQETVKIDNEKLIKEKKTKLTGYASEAIEATGKIKKLKVELEALSYDADEEAKLSKNKQRLSNEIYANEQEIRRLEKEGSFYHDTETCPTCKQNIEAGFSAEVIHTNEAKVAELRKNNGIYAAKLEEIKASLGEIAKVRSKINELRSQQNTLNSEVSSIKRLVESIQADIKRLQEPVEEKVKGDRRPLEEELETAAAAHEAATNQAKLFSVAAQLLKDGGIKAQIIKQYVPVMNQLINQHLAAMDFFVDFQIDENFEEKILSRYRDDFAYESFSEGQKTRIDLAILFSWRAIAKMRNSVSTNLLVMDEILDGSMDDEGVAEFLRIINNLTDKSNVFIMSHRGEALTDKFANTITFELVQNFTEMKESA